jgi:predicted TIM-barrel fold metal-dependent hydrolase
LGDWCFARGVELCIEYDLPFKIHTGYYAGTGRMPVERIPAGNLWPMLARYPQARFVLMHIAYPYSDELVALVKQYPNTYADLCWAWSIDPYSSSLFVRRFIHAAPANKLFVFGGDTSWPQAAVAYAHQTRQWLTRTLQAEVDEGLATEKEAIKLASRFMRENQYACFNVEQKKQMVLR